MAVATLTRDTTSISIPLIEENGQTVQTRDIGHPSLQIQETGNINPRSISQWSVLESYNLLGRFHPGHTSDPYQDAIDLANLIKSNSNGQPLMLDLTDLPEHSEKYMVAPAAGQDQALSVAYHPGQREWVDVDLGLTRVSSTQGGSDQPASTPTSTGSGPIVLRYNGVEVPLERDIEVERSVGRPNSTTRKASNSRYPNYYDRHSTAYEGLELSLQFGSNTVSKVNDLVEMFSQQLGRDYIQLDFQGVYGMGEFACVPDGSGAIRFVRRAGEEGVVITPTISMRRVYSTS